MIREEHSISMATSTSFIMLVIFLMVLGGSSWSISGKIMDQTVMLHGVSTQFKHPLHMTLMMSLGEALLLPLFAFNSRNDGIDKRLVKANPLLFLGPAILDVFGSTGNNFAFAYLSVSSY